MPLCVAKNALKKFCVISKDCVNIANRVAVDFLWRKIQI